MSGDYFFDTNSVIYYLQGRPEWVDFIDNTPMTERSASVITRMELLSYPAIEPQEEADIRRFLDDVTVVPMSEAIENKATTIRRDSRLKLPDAIVVATAVVLNATLITGDKRLAKFRLPGLRTVNPYC